MPKELFSSKYTRFIVLSQQQGKDKAKPLDSMVSKTETKRKINQHNLPINILNQMLFHKTPCDSVSKMILN